MAFVNGLTNHAQDQLAIRFGITEQSDLKNIAKLLQGKEGVDWFLSRAHAQNQEKYPGTELRLVKYKNNEIILPVVMNSETGEPLATTALRSYRVEDSLDDVKTVSDLEEELANLQKDHQDLLKKLFEAETENELLKQKYSELEFSHARLAAQVSEVEDYRALRAALKLVYKAMSSEQAG